MLAPLTLVERELYADEINWELGPVPEPPPMTQSDQAVEAIVDALAYRLLACEAMDALRTVTIDRDRAREEIGRLRECRRA